jgi:hypothetical protein
MLPEPTPGSREWARFVRVLMGESGDGAQAWEDALACAAYEIADCL